ncbi:MAG: hypothetical protein WB559_02415 [Candidatus Acidiferrales bacterium]
MRGGASGVCSIQDTWIRDRRSMWERRFDWLGDMLAEPDEKE